MPDRLTRAEIERLYPDCPDAVMECEMTLSPETWDVCRSYVVRGLTPELAAQFIRQSMEELEQLTGGKKDFAQMMTPGFSRYCGAKLGLM